MKEFEARTLVSVWGNVLTEIEPLRNCLQPFMRAHHSGLLTGDINVRASVLAINRKYILIQISDTRLLLSIQLTDADSLVLIGRSPFSHIVTLHGWGSFTVHSRFTSPLPPSVP